MRATEWLPEARPRAALTGGSSSASTRGTPRSSIRLPEPCSPTSLALVDGFGLAEVFVLAPMISFDYDEPQSVVGRLERRFRRAMTKRVLHEAGKVRRHGTTVTILGPGREDLEAIGINLMDHTRRLSVFETSLRTSAAALAGGATTLPAA